MVYVQKSTHRLVDFQNISLLLLQIVNLASGVNLLAICLALNFNGLLEHVRDIRHRPGRSTEVESTLFLQIGLANSSKTFPHTVLDVDLL